MYPAHASLPVPVIEGLLLRNASSFAYRVEMVQRMMDAGRVSAADAWRVLGAPP